LVEHSTVNRRVRGSSPLGDVFNTNPYKLQFFVYFMDFKEVIKKRASIRKYSPKKVSVEDVVDCIMSANTSPSPGNLALLNYIVVSDKKLIEQLKEACQQDFIADAQFLVVVCSDNKQAVKMYDKRGDKYLKQHAGAAIENFLLRITDLGLASCWVGAFSEMMVKNILKIPDEIEVEAILPVAYESKELKIKSKQRIKPDLNARTFFNAWRNKFFKKPEIIKSAYD
jgi:nitroreductase